MIIGLRFSSLRQTHWSEYLLRFGLGGFVTAAAGAIAAAWGPLTGGLFLAFPAIFCASVTLVEKHERRRKERLRLAGDRRGRDAAALEAYGTVLGSPALAAFALTFLGLAERNAALAFVSGIFAWVVIAVGVWWFRKSLFWLFGPCAVARGVRARPAAKRRSL